jgi:hypothetical protein
VIEIIRSDVINKFPDTKNLLLPSIFHLKTDILPNPKLSEYYNNMKTNFQIGPQYEWLACFAHQFEIEDLELCIVNQEHTCIIENSYMSILFPELKGKMHDCKLRDKIANENILLFSHFRFPVAHLRKTEMKELSEQYNFYDIMCKTWTCHQPTSGGRLCGVCVPCKARIDSTVKTQVPFSKTRFAKQKWFSLKNNLSTIKPIKMLWNGLKQMKKRKKLAMKFQ